MFTMYIIILHGLIAACLSISGETNQNSPYVLSGCTTEWVLGDLLNNPDEGIRITGTPEITESRYGKALHFDGSGDGIFLESMPLDGLEQFTIEAIFQPASGGNFEQRFLHFGEVQGNRVLLEIRSTKTHWYFDAFIKSEDQQKTLIDSNLLHPLDQWYHVAFVIDHGELETYVNGTKELEGHIDLVALHGGRTSIGVRQNERSWFKGAIYKISVSPKALKPKKFMPY